MKCKAITNTTCSYQFIAHTIDDWYADAMPKRFIPVNELLARTTLEQFVTHYNFPTEIKRSGNEEKIRNPFACEKCAGNSQAVSVNWQSGVFTSHCYHCSTRGRVTTLLFGMKYGRQPSGSKLQGQEFKDIAEDIAQVANYRTNESTEKAPMVEPPTIARKEPAPRKINLPLSKNEDPRIAKLEHLSDEFVFDVDEMNGRATGYLAKRLYFTQDVMNQWGVGFLPTNSKSMLRGNMVYELRNERSEKIGYVGRDLGFEDKIRKWENSDRSSKQPIKAKFPPGFAKGEFLYGAEVNRLRGETAKAQLADTGLLVLEGMNDVIAVDQLGLLSVSLCTNRITEGQIEKLSRWSRDLSGGKITLMLDNDHEGFEGSLESLKKLSAHAHVRTVWTPDCFGGKYRGKQPEELERNDLMALFKRFSDGTTLRLLDGAV
jgi:hypothetical protein